MKEDIRMEEQIWALGLAERVLVNSQAPKSLVVKAKRVVARIMTSEPDSKWCRQKAGAMHRWFAAPRAANETLRHYA